MIGSKHVELIIKIYIYYNLKGKKLPLMRLYVNLIKLEILYLKNGTINLIEI